MKKLTIRKAFATILTVGWMGLIFYLSHQPASVSSELSGSFVDVVVPIISLLPLAIDSEVIHFYLRKSAHFIAYFTLGFLVLHTIRLFNGMRVRSGVLALLIAVLYAISDEVHQLFIPGRSGEVGDVVIDSAGSFTGICIYVLLSLLYNKLCARGR